MITLGAGTHIAQRLPAVAGIARELAGSSMGIPGGAEHG